MGLTPNESPSQSKTIPKAPARIGASPSPSTQQAMQKRSLAAAKFSNRLRTSIGESNQVSTLAKRAASPSATQPSPRSASATHDRERPRGGFNKPTTASLAKASPPTSAFLTAGNKFPRGENGRATPPNTKRLRAASSNASPGTGRPSTSSAIPPTPQSPPRGAGRVRRNSLPSSQGGAGPKQLRTKHSSEKLGQHGKFVSETDSGVVLYNQYWQEDK